MIAYSALSRLGLQIARSIRRQELHFPLQNHFLTPAPRVLWSSPCYSSSTTHGDSSSRPKAVIFDLGGVVVPSPLQMFTEFEKQHNLPPGSVVDTIKRTGADGSFARLERGELNVGEFAEPFAEEYYSIFGTKAPSEIFKELLESFRVGRQVTACPAVLEVIAKLQEHGVKTAILTNNFRYDDGYTLFPKEKLDVDVVVESCVEGVRKPERSIYQTTLDRLRVKPSDAIFLDDIGSNLKAAREIGIHTIKVEDITEALEALEEVMNLGALRKGHIVGTREVNPKLLFHTEGLAIYLNRKHGLWEDGPLFIRQFVHGQSNPTYYIICGNTQLVLRKKPPGKLLPSAHAVEREYRVMKAAREAGVPIPHLFSLCEDNRVIGTPFYVMSYVLGRVLKNPALPGLQPSQRKRIYGEMVRVLSSIHSVDIEKAGLSDFGKHGNYLSRQFSRWSKQYLASETHSIPAMNNLMKWMNTVALPPDRTTIVHGDYRLDNLIYSPDEDKVLAVLDWELSTLGDPVSDLAYVCMPFHMEPDQPHFKGLLGLNLDQLGIPSEEDVVKQYCLLGNETRDVTTNWSLYLAFTFFRVAAILQGVYKRSLQNQSSADNAKAVGLMAENFAKKGWHFAQKHQAQGTSHTVRPANTRSYSTFTRVPPHPSKTANHSPRNCYSSTASTKDSLMGLMTGDVESFPPLLSELREKLAEFMRDHVFPNEKAVLDHQLSSDRWTPLPLIEELKSEARSCGLWNLFLPLDSDPGHRYGAGLSNLEYAHLAEMMGHCIFASELFNCSAPDTGNMEVLVKYGTEQQKEEWLTRLLSGEIRSCFAMTEPAVASSDATNIQGSIVRQGDSYIINGHKWWISGAMDPRCKLCIFMGKTDPQAPRHKQQAGAPPKIFRNIFTTKEKRAVYPNIHSMILVPMESPGVRVVRPLTVFQYDDAPSGHAEMEFKDVTVPVDNLLLGEGRGFEIAQGRLGPGRVHHCMRLIGMAERSLQLMTSRVQGRVVFGKPLAEQGTILSDIAQSRIEIEQARLLTLKAAHKMDTVGNKAAREDIAMIKVVAPLMAQRVVDRSMQAHGAMGLSADQPLAQFFSWARILRLADGPDEVHTAALGKMELKKNRS